MLPVDSEHNAVFQALGANRKADLHRIILTASGGPFRTWSADQIRNATVEQALKHPNWAMGQKVTIDSATMMNKGLELIEAHHLFALPSIQIDVLVHPQSIVHGMVEFRDGSMIAQLSSPDMRVPIAHCLAWPERIEGAAQRLDLAKVATLTFEAPDPDQFPALRVARAAMDAASGATTILNAANEIAVEAFLSKRLGFGAIVPLVEETMLAAQRRGINHEPENVDDALSIDHISRSLAESSCLKSPQRRPKALLTGLVKTSLKAARAYMFESFMSGIGSFGAGFLGYLIPFLFVLTIVVFFHELGHFLVARWCGIRVLVFSIGFGPELFGFNDRHGTRWKISAIPLGGYVKFFGDDNAASVPDTNAVGKHECRRTRGQLLLSAGAARAPRSWRPDRLPISSSRS